jgi:hypothetical protein
VSSSLSPNATTTNRSESNSNGVNTRSGVGVVFYFR